jgi:lipopolysaccharide export system protein LptA
MRASRLGRACLFVLAWTIAAAAAFAEPIDFSADSVQSSLAKDRERTVLSGNVKVRTGSISITADRVELFGKDFIYLQCSGSVKVEDSDRKIRLESPSLYYDRTRKLARAIGPSVLQDDKNKLVLKAEWIENDGENEITIAEIAVRIVKDKLACRAEYVLYRRKENTLELTGSPSVYKNGDNYEASRMIVNTETEDIALEGEVKGSVTSNTSSSKTAPPSQVPAPSATPPAATPSGATPPASAPSGSGGSSEGAAPAVPAAPSTPDGTGSGSTKGNGG